MATRSRITIAQTQRLSLNPALAASIRVLRSDAAGLTRFLEEQAAENPALILTPPPERRDWLPRWTEALSQGQGNAPEPAAADPSLAAHVLEEIRRLRLPPADLRAAEVLAGALEPSGWLGRPLAALVPEAGGDAAHLAAVLARLQRIDPPGLFARDLAECLALQAAEAGEMDAAMQGVLSRLPLVAAGRLDRLAAETGVPVEAVAARIARLRRYDPKPGARFAPGSAAPLAEPDLTVRRGPGGWEVALNRGALPALSVAAGAGRGTGRAAAQALIRLVEGRNATLLRVAAEIFRRQSAALDHGFAALMPMTMAEVGAALDLHQTTVSRVVAGAAADTPRGTWWLRALFSSAPGPGSPPAEAIRALLARLVAAEDPAAPLSDAALAAALAATAGPVARRTIAKYRGILGIPPAHARRRRARPVVSGRDPAPQGR